ncbi:ribosome maturation factor RimM [Aquirhabdus parva]|uniref:Ribosome maturation factor RimM n=1 Tax=Aquirhabdus parva TaxID=2283318 RepID=A0A345P2L5_9GAMM|nr:ribosome maturation factor RimM [Aquirhabdus parva]AXI01524.1 ribosome maturation factor RimM [Aquirhabdus parva]
MHLDAVPLDVLPTDRIKVGELRAAYGLQGWLWLYSDTDPISNIFGYQPWWVETRTGWKQMEVKRWRTQGKGLVVSLVGVLDRTAADLLMGATIWVNRAALPAAPANEYYWSDLVGLHVYAYDIQDSAVEPAPVFLGAIHELFETGANDVIVVRPVAGSVDQVERLIPWHKDIIRNIDMTAKRMDVNWGVDY